MTDSPGAAVRKPGGADLARLRQLAVVLERARSAVRFVDYRQAESDCAQLAEELLATIPKGDLAAMHFVGAPRGGLVVLGILSYLLRLEPRQLRPPAEPDTPVVLVDDCALTGARIHRELRLLGERPVTVALLYAHPDLRRAVVEREARVGHCLAARDLADRARDLYPDPEDRRRWREQWSQRLGDERYWLGLADYVCFAWSEPERLLWNPVTGIVEDGWRFLSAERCLKNRMVAGLPPIAARPRRWRVDPSVVVGTFEDGVLLYRGRDDEVFRLEGVAARMWHALAAWGNRRDVLDHLRTEYEVDIARLGADLDRFVESLLAGGLLEEKRQAGRRDAQVVQGQ